MSERIFRLIQGIYLVIFLFLEIELFIYILIGTMAFEGLTNWRIPKLVSRLRYGATMVSRPVNNSNFRINLDSEQMQRLAMALFLVLTFVLFPAEAWYGPWFLAFLLVMAGTTNICPMVIFMRWVGFK